MIPFRVLALIMAAVFAALFVILAAVPASYLKTYGIVPNAASDFLGLRASPMFLGLAVMFYLARNAPPSDLRNALCTGTAIMFLGIACTGLYEYGRGFANPGIAVAAVAEMIAAAILLLSRR